MRKRKRIISIKKTQKRQHRYQLQIKIMYHTFIYITKAFNTAAHVAALNDQL